MTECRKIHSWEQLIFHLSHSISLKKMLIGTRWAIYISNIDADREKLKCALLSVTVFLKLKLTNNSLLLLIIIDNTESWHSLCFKCLILMPSTVINHIHPHEIMKNISSNSTYLKILIFITALVWYLDKQNSYL